MLPPSFRSFQSHAYGFFSAFAHATCSLSVYSQYLGLGFNAPVFTLHNQAELLFRSTSPSHLTYEAVTLYGRSFQSVQLMFWITSCTTSPRLLQGRIRFALLQLSLVLLAASIFLSFPAGTKIFQFPAFAHAFAYNSGDPRFKARLAATLGLSQLATAFIAATAKPSPRWLIINCKLFSSINRAKARYHKHNDTRRAYALKAVFSSKHKNAF